VFAGGESTTMALVAEKWGLIPELQGFAKAGKPVWGTCAGMIFLAERAEGEQILEPNQQSHSLQVAGNIGRTIKFCPCRHAGVFLRAVS
jgi:glutamine amidotransferase PdxT